MGHYFTNDANLPSEIRKHKVTIMNQEYLFNTDNGVFSKGHLDDGTRLLLETITTVSGNVLDVGCGYGPIGIFLAKNYDCEVDMVDVNRRALHLTKKNIEENRINNAICFESDAYQNITKKYNYIVTNPPIRAGKKKLYEILFGAKEHLYPNGEVWLVIRKDQGAKSAIEDLSLEYIVEVVKKSKGFYIIRLISR